MGFIHLKSGEFEQVSENELGSVAPASIMRRALLVYEGEFESMDGQVIVGRDELTTLATNHNGYLESASRLAEGKESMKDYPPVQLDHSTSAKDTVGRLVGKLELAPHKTKDGKEVMAAYGNVKILGEENVAKVMDGRWTHLSVGVDFEKGKFSELTITPFPAAPEASLLKKNLSDTKLAGREALKIIEDLEELYDFYEQDKIEPEQNLKYVKKIKSELKDMYGSEENKKKAKQLTDELINHLEDTIIDGDRKNNFSSKDTEMSKKKSVGVSLDSMDREYHLDKINKELQVGKNKNKVLINGQEPFVQLSEGDKSMDKEKMKKHLMEKEELSAEQAEEKMAKCSDEEMKKLAAEVEEKEKKMAADEEKEKKEMAEEKPEEKKEMSEKKDEDKKDLEEKEDEEKKEMSEEKEKKLTAARENIVKLSSDFRKAFEGSQLAAKKGKILSRLSALRANAKITPAEIKKIDVEKLAGQSDEALALVLKTYEDREPVIMTGALGSIKADELHRLSNEIKMSRLEAETRKNMSLLKHTVKTKMAESEESGEVSIHVDTTPHVDQEIEMAYGSLCKMMDEGKLAEAKELLKKYMMKPKSEGKMDMADHDKQLTALAEESIKMQNKFDELQKLAVSLVG